MKVSLALISLGVTAPLYAQDHSHHQAPSEAAPKTAQPIQIHDPHAGHNMADHAPSGTDINPQSSETAAPTPPTDHAAELYYPAQDMAKSRAQLAKEHGGAVMNMVVFDLAEIGIRKGQNSYRWNAMAWFGGDINRLVVKSEGEGIFGAGLEHAEIQALYSHAIGPYFNIQTGIRHDIRPTPSQSYAVIGIEGLAPYWFDLDAAIFLSEKGNLLARIEVEYDQRLTQRLILQPRIEMNFSAQNIPEFHLGSGLSDIDMGLRLRYEIAREFAPYIGISHTQKIGQTARIGRKAGEELNATSFVLGVRAWF